MQPCRTQAKETETAGEEGEKTAALAGYSGGHDVGVPLGSKSGNEKSHIYWV